MFKFDFDPDLVLLRIVQSDYWEMEEFQRFAAEYRNWHRLIGQRHPSYRVISDCTDFPVQSAEVGAAFAQFSEEIMADIQGRFAILAKSMMNKMQAKRAIPQPNVQVFFDRDEAMAWLFEAGSA